MGKISSEQLQELSELKVLTLPTTIESVSGYPVSLECYIIPTDSPRRWILVTAIANRIAIGFVDGRFFGDSGNAGIESPHILRSGRYDLSHVDIRFKANPDGIYVDESERGRGIGRELMLSIREIFLGLGARRIIVSQPEDSALGFYEKLGYKLTLGAVWMDIDNNE